MTSGQSCIIYVGAWGQVNTVAKYQVSGTFCWEIFLDTLKHCKQSSIKDKKKIKCFNSGEIGSNIVPTQQDLHIDFITKLNWIYIIIKWLYRFLKVDCIWLKSLIKKNVGWINKPLKR